MDPLLKVSNIDKNFDGVKALSNVSFEIYPGEKVSLVGENGSGKSTVIKIISGVIKPTAGSITVCSLDKRYLTPKESIKAGIQVIYQDFSLYPNLTVEENIASNYFLSRNNFFISYKKMREIAKIALSKIKLDIPLRVLAKDLSIAQRQTVAIAKSLLEDAKIIIMDEATTALTQKEVENLIEIINDLQNQGIALLFVSHKLEEIKAVSDRCIFLRNGHKIAEKSTYLLTEKDIVKYMSGLDYVQTRPVRCKCSNDNYLFEYKNVETKNLKNISFNIKRGEIVGFAGRLGAGRTELALSMFGDKRILKGDAFLCGKKIQFNSITDAINFGIGYLPEDRLKESLFLDKSIGLNMVSAKFYDSTIPLGIINNRKLKYLADIWMKRLSIKSPSSIFPVSSLSGGNQQRVVLARWLMRNLKLMILNRPTVGVDVAAKQEINRIIINLASKGMSFVVISDDLPEFLNLCHKVYFVKDGRISRRIEGEDLTIMGIRDGLI